MLARVRARLTYANVVATLALFVSLGGSSYAVSQITSRDVKNRSLKGGDMRRDTLTGKEINESKMGAVPNALRSLSATNASVADLSKDSERATTAGTATLADTARDAQALAGQGAASFEQSSTVQFGRASATPSGTSSEQVLLSWPELGAELRTSIGQGCGATQVTIGVRNTKTSGPSVRVFENDPGPVVLPQTTNRFCGQSGSATEFDAELTDSTGRTLFVDCLVADSEIRCIGIRSEP